MSDEPTKPTLDELITPFRADPLNNAVVILGDEEGVRVLSAFRMVEHAWRYPRAKLLAGASLVARWRWLCSLWKFDVDAIAAAAGLSEETVQSKLAILLANRLIYPDGTISKGAQFALEAHAQTKLGLKPKRSNPQGPATAATAAPKETK